MLLLNQGINYSQYKIQRVLQHVAMSSQRCNDVQQYLVSSLRKSRQGSQAAEFGVTAAHQMSTSILEQQKRREYGTCTTEVESVRNIAP